jgi:hypothetical protein
VFFIQKTEEGGWILLAVESECPLLFEMPARLRRLLEKPDFSDRIVARLFPQAYPDDPSAEAEFQKLLRNDLVARKLECAAAVEKVLARRKRHQAKDVTIAELHLRGEDLAHWLGFLHDSRLTIGTALDIDTEGWEGDLDPDAPDFDERLLLNQLSYLEEIIVQAMREAEGLDG